MADWKIDYLGNKTPLQYADTANMDKLALMGRTGMLKTVPDGFHPGSEVANSAILGYDQRKVYEGRGPLEAASMGIELCDDDFALRCNLICVDGKNIKNHSAGRLETEEGDVLIRFLEEKLGSDRIHFHTGIQYRHLLVIKGGDKHIECVPPHDVPGQPFMPLLVKPTAPRGEETAKLLNSLILKSQELLKNHPLNLQRMCEGKDPANSIWPWSGGFRPKMKTLQDAFPGKINSGAVITAVDLIRGIGKYAGLESINVEGATGLADTNYEGKAKAAIKALKHTDFVYLHVEASDEAGHDGDVELKLKTIENLDKKIVGPVMNAAKLFDEPVAIAVLPDHPTPCKHRTHTNEPVPFLIYYPGIKPDSVEKFDEFSCKNGDYGMMIENQFIKEFMKH